MGTIKDLVLTALKLECYKLETLSKVCKGALLFFIFDHAALHVYGILCLLVCVFVFVVFVVVVVFFFFTKISFQIQATVLVSKILCFSL